MDAGLMLKSARGFPVFQRESMLAHELLNRLVVRNAIDTTWSNFA